MTGDAQDVRRNADGYRIGEGHHNAKHSDALVTYVRDLREHRRMRYDAIIDLVQRERLVRLSYGTVRKWCNYERR